VEWIVTTGRTVDEAKDAALDQLGVAEDEAEFEVVDEARTGLFGRLRTEAKVRARVRPVQPPPKVDRRRSDRKRRSRSGGEGRTESGRSDAKQATGTTPSADRADTNRTGSGRADARRSSGRSRSRSGGSPSEERRASAAAPAADEPSARSKGAAVNEVEIPLAEHADMTRAFVEGLLDAFGLEGEVTVEELDEETAEVRVEGQDLGLLIGRGGATLQAVQTLARSAAQRDRSHVLQGRVFIEIGGYRKQRKEALERFTLQLVEDVKAAGVEKALEPMGAADRKVVHDTVNDCEGVKTISVGEEPRRRVVIVPE
jgi:spoIIIJ-associated protein